MRPVLLLTLIGVVCAAAFPEGMVTSAAAGLPALRRPLSVDLVDVPLADTLEVLAERLSVSVDYRGSADAPRHVTLQLSGASAEVVLTLLAWETDTQWFLAAGVLHCGSADDLAAGDPDRSRRERAGRLARVSEVLRRRLDEPLPFRLRAQGVELAELLRFLERECSVPFLLDARCGEVLESVVEQNLEADSLAHLLDQLLSPEPFKETLGWTVVGDAVVVSTPESLASVRARLR